MATYLPTQDVLNVTVSCFANYSTPTDPKPVRMITWLTNTKYQPIVDRIRAESQKAKRDADKATLPAITPSGEFAYRAADKLKPNGHSRLIQFDIDLKDNRHIRNYTELKAQIAKLPFVVYCGLSVSGTGLWGLVPIAYPERHGQHFDALKRIFAHYHIMLDDKPRNVASLRGYSYDPAGYFARQVMLFELYDEPLPPKAHSFDFSRFADEDDAKLLHRIVRLVEEAGEGNRHGMLLKASRLAGGYVAAGRLDEQTVVYALETIASEWSMFVKSQKTIRDGIKYGQAAPIYPEERTTPLIINSKTCSRPTGKTGKSPEPIESTECVSIPVESVQRVQPTVTRLESESVTVIVSTLDDWFATPNSILKPDESQLERLAVEPCETYPTEWDEPSPAGAVPIIKAITFFEWQRSKQSSFHQMGLASLKTDTGQL